MVVCEDGRMKRSEYRKFKIRGSKPGTSVIGHRTSDIGQERSERNG
jgi:excinuclease UvrABC nuclease subunit